MADNTDKIIDCPACGKPMEKIYMDEQAVYLDVCIDGCGGIFFDNREFKKFDEEHEDITPLKNAYNGKKYPQLDTCETRICPVCSMKMVKHYASVKQEIQVDECYSCGGLFLDYSELERIREQYSTSTERSADSVKDLHYKFGSELRYQDLLHSNIKENSFVRQFVRSVVKNYI